MKPLTFLAASLLTSTLCAATPALPDSLHIVYLMPFEGPEGTIGHIYWANGGWTFEEATLQANAPAARSDSYLSGYFQVDTSHDPPIISQHVFYIDVSNHVHELSQVNAYVFTEPWTHNDIFQEAANNPSSSSPIVSPATGTTLAGYYIPATAAGVNSNTHHVIYIGVDSHVHELRWDGQNGWQHNDLNQLTAVGVNSGPGGAIIGRPIDPDLGGQFVSYLDSDGRVAAVWWICDDPSSPTCHQWWPVGLPSLYAGAPNAAAGSALGSCDNLIGAAWSASVCVTYVGIDRHVHLVSIGTDGNFHQSDLTQSAVNNPSNPGAFPNPAVGSSLPFSPGLDWGGVGQVVAYIGEDGDVHHLRWDNTFSAWTHTDHTSGGSGTALGVAVVQLDGDNALSEHVVYIGNDGHVHELSLNTKFQTWFNNDLTSSATATVPIPSSALATYVGPAW